MLVLLVFSQSAASDTYLNIYGFAYHTEDSRYCAADKSACRDRPNQMNSGLGIRQTRSYADVGAGAFKDSFDDWLYYAGVEKQWKILGPLHAGAQAFAVGRKTVNNYFPLIGVLPVVSLRAGRLSISMSYVPKIESRKADEVYFFYTSYEIY